MTYVPPSARPMKPLAVQSNGPHLASHDLEMQQQTVALWSRHGMGAYSWAWWDPTSAPKAVLSAANTWITFDFYKTGTGSVNYPLALGWLLHQRANTVEAEAYFLSPAAAPVSIRLVLRDYVDAITDEYSNASEVTTIIPSTTVPFSRWQLYANDTGGGRLFKTKVRVHPSTGITGTTRNIALGLQANYDVPVFPYASTVALPVRLLALHVHNIVKEPV